MRAAERLLGVVLCAWMLGCGDGGKKITAAEEPSAAPVQLSIGEVILQVDGSPAVLLLRADGGAILLPVSSCESGVIYFPLHDLRFEHPITHDLFKTLADSLSISVSQVLLDASLEDSLFASIALSGPGGSVTLMAEAGDALAIAQRMSARIMGSRAFLTNHTLRTGPNAPAAGRPAPASDAWAEAPPEPAARRAKALQEDDLIELKVVGVAQRSFSSNLTVLLMDAGNSAVFPIGMGFCQGLAIFTHFQNPFTPEVQIHDLLRSVLEAGGAHTTHATLVDFENNTFVGELGLAMSGRTLILRVRPSDAIALAVLADLPIRVSRTVFTAFAQDPAPWRRLIEAQQPRR